MMANRKVFREFTSVRIVQQWQAHAGVIWTVSFSDTGAFMATGGKDRIIRVWENKRAPVEAGRAQAPSHNPGVDSFPSHPACTVEERSPRVVYVLAGAGRYSASQQN